MRRIKMGLMSTAIVAAICCSFASRNPDPCVDAAQYYFTGIVYLPAGEFGYNYDCDWEPAINCTWYRPNPSLPDYYNACHRGGYIFIQANK